MISYPEVDPGHRWAAGGLLPLNIFAIIGHNWAQESARILVMAFGRWLSGIEILGV